jgi:hypothetical protein
MITMSFLRKFEWRVLSDFSFSLCSLVEFLKQIKRIHVFFDYSFIVFLWSVLSFNQIVDDSLADFFLQDFLHFIDFVVIEKFRRKILWYDVVVFSFFVRLQVKDVKYIVNAIKWKKNKRYVCLFIVSTMRNDFMNLCESFWLEFFNLMFLINNIIKFSVLKFNAICFRL